MISVNILGTELHGQLMPRGIMFKIETPNLEDYKVQDFYVFGIPVDFIESVINEDEEDNSIEDLFYGEPISLEKVIGIGYVIYIKAKGNKIYVTLKDLLSFLLNQVK